MTLIGRVKPKTIMKEFKKSAKDYVSNILKLSLKGKYLNMYDYINIVDDDYKNATAFTYRVVFTYKYLETYTHNLIFTLDMEELFTFNVTEYPRSIRTEMSIALLNVQNTNLFKESNALLHGFTAPKVSVEKHELERFYRGLKTQFGRLRLLELLQVHDSSIGDNYIAYCLDTNAPIVDSE